MRNILGLIIIATVIVGCETFSGNSFSSNSKVSPPHVAIISHKSKYVINPHKDQYIVMGPAYSKASASKSTINTAIKVKFTLQGQPLIQAVTVPFYVAIVDQTMNVVYRHDGEVTYLPGEIKKAISTNISFKPKTSMKASDYNAVIAFSITSEQLALQKQHKKIINSKLNHPPSAKDIARMKLQRYNSVN